MQLSTLTSETNTNAFELQPLWAERIGGKNRGKVQNIYKFEKIKQAKAKARQEFPGRELLDFGIGEPDGMAFDEVVETLITEAQKPENNGYADNGVMFFKEAVCSYMQRVFQVTLDSNSEVIHAMGGKSALALLALCFVNPGDYILDTSPGYPIFATHTRYLGGHVFSFPLLKENGYLPDFSIVPDDVLSKAKVLLLNYPNNPTGACVDLNFYDQAIQFAKKNQLMIIQDAAYAPLSFSQKPLSILEHPGAKTLAVEVHSLSKAFNMTGWRMGWVCGNAEIVKAFGEIKSNTDSGQYIPIQYAAAKAISSPLIMDCIYGKYKKRMDTLASMLNELGFDAKPADGTFFLYTRAPKKIKHSDGEEVFFETAESFSHWLIEKHGICTVPWDDVEQAVRFSVTYKSNSDEKILAELKKRLKDYTFYF